MALSMDSIYKLPKSKKIALLVVILGVVIGLSAYVVFIPQQNERKAKKAELNRLVLELEENKAIVKEFEKFKEELAKLNIEFANALTQLPNEKEIPEILKNISALGKESRLEFTLFKPKPEEPQQFYAKVPIELIALGNYHDTGIFFDSVSKLPRIINVVNFSMSRAKDKDIKGKEAEYLVKTSCLVNTYRFIEPKPEEKKKVGGKPGETKAFKK
jgi:type IV pilus assembly protein PilO